MLAKWIVCQVPAALCESFSDAQREWAAVARCAGFAGQCAGFVGDEAHVLAWWFDRDSYDAFMNGVHDDIVTRSAQARSYSAIRVALLSETLDIPGHFVSFAGALVAARWLRIADCVVHPGRIDHFVLAQREVWKPGMGGAEGMLYGSFLSSLDDPCRFVVVSLWTDRPSHDRYASTVVPGYRGKASTGDDLASIEVFAVDLVPGWSVSPPPPGGSGR